MIPVGYMLKKVAEKPAWLQVDSVVDIYSVKSCMSPDFADYANFWKHNGYWFFDQSKTLTNLAAEEHIDVSGCTLFYYEAYEMEYREEDATWSKFSPTEDITTQVVEPRKMELAGFDVVPFSCGTSAECSPLSCCALAREMDVNEHCLFRTFEDARIALESGRFNNSEPGPFRIFSVYRVIDG
jgi:hypothetical protein